MISERRENALTVGELNRYVKMLMDNDALLSAVSVKGEISNLKYHSSGHLYFTLKDGDAEIGAVAFRSAAVNLKFTPRDGMQVVAFGRVSIYEKSGKCQLYVSAMLFDTNGNPLGHVFNILEVAAGEKVGFECVSLCFPEGISAAVTSSAKSGSLFL